MKREGAEKRVGTALLLIDVINDLDFPEGDQLLEFALPMAERLRDLKRRAKTSEIPVIYINDNFGRWTSDWKAQVEHCSRRQSRGRRLTQMLLPDEDEYFVLKPKHSGFYSTTLDVLLQHLGVRSVILTGLATNICVLFTANDAYMRDYGIVAPRDCSAANTAADHDYAIGQMESVLKGACAPSTELDLASLLRGE